LREALEFNILTTSAERWNRREPGVADEKILIVDPDQAARRRLAKVLRQRGLQPVEASGGEEALKELAKEEYAVVFLDLAGVGPDVVGRMIEQKPELSIIVLAPPASAGASAATAKGAYTALATPVQPVDLEIGLRNALERYDLFRTNTRLRHETLQDDLTGVLNRRYLDRYLGEEIERSRRYKHPFSSSSTSIISSTSTTNMGTCRGAGCWSRW